MTGWGGGAFPPLPPLSPMQSRPSSADGRKSPRASLHKVTKPQPEELAEEFCVANDPRVAEFEAQMKAREAPPVEPSISSSKDVQPRTSEDAQPCRSEDAQPCPPLFIHTRRDDMDGQDVAGDMKLSSPCGSDDLIAWSMALKLDDLEDDDAMRYSLELPEGC